jgi:hypothetical protein
MSLRSLFSAMCLIAILTGVASSDDPPTKTVLGIEGTQFTLNDKPTFLLGISYYAGLAVDDEQRLASDLDEIKRRGFNWLRVWATWSGFDHDVSAVDAAGRGREEHLKRLVRLVAAADARGLIVDVTITRGEGQAQPPGLQTAATHTRAALTIAEALQGQRNWYLDLANERNIQDKRFASLEEIKAARDAVKRHSGGLLVTASQGGDISREEVAKYLKAGVDFLTPHRPRDKKAITQTAATTKQLLQWSSEAGRAVPVLYQEPFRRDYGPVQPTAEDFLADLRQARQSHAAGWCLHNGSNRNDQEGHPRRSFDLRGEQSLFERLDEVELEVVKRVAE